MTGGQVAPTTPLTANASTMPYGNFEPPFNIPFLADSCGAVYVARWSALHVRRLVTAFAEAIATPGFSVVEVVTPCSTLYARRNRLGTGLELMKFYHDHCVIKHGASTRDVDISFQSDIVLGKFVERERPTFVDSMNQWYGEVFGEKYQPYEGSVK
jgi:2-oxoglutarate ferredoxin oxidoreductase subunit beta